MSKESWRGLNVLSFLAGCAAWKYVVPMIEAGLLQKIQPFFTGGVLLFLLLFLLITGPHTHKM